jgi:hypothetical protein
MRRKDSPKKKSRSPARSRHGSKGSPKKRYSKVEKSEMLSSPSYKSPSYPYASSSSTYIPPALFSPPPPPPQPIAPIVPQKEGFFEKHKTVIFVGIALILLAAVGVVLFLFLKKPADAAPAPQPLPPAPSTGPSSEITVSNPDSSDFNSIPINTQFRPLAIISSPTSIKLAAAGVTSVIDDHYFGVGAVAQVYTFTFNLVKTKATFTTATISYLQFYGYISIYVTPNGKKKELSVPLALESNVSEDNKQYFKSGSTLSVSPGNTSISSPISSKKLGDSADDTITATEFGLPPGGIVAQKLTNINISDFLTNDSGIAEGANTFTIEYAAVGSGAILFDFSFNYTPI